MHRSIYSFEFAFLRRKKESAVKVNLLNIVRLRSSQSFLQKSGNACLNDQKTAGRRIDDQM